MLSCWMRLLQMLYVSSLLRSRILPPAQKSVRFCYSHSSISSSLYSAASLALGSDPIRRETHELRAVDTRSSLYHKLRCCKTSAEEGMIKTF